MKIHRTPGKDLIYDLAYHNDSLSSKILLMFLGGIGTFLRNIFRGDIPGAFLGPASHLYSVAGTAFAKVKKIPFGLINLLWLILGIAAAAQAIGFGLIAYLGVTDLKWGKSPGDYDVLAAQALSLWKAKYLAINLVWRGLEQFPKNVLLTRRLVYCYMAIGRMALVRSCLHGLMKDFEHESQPEIQLRIARTLVEGWKFLGDEARVCQWIEKARAIPGHEKVLDQLAKLTAA